MSHVSDARNKKCPICLSKMVVYNNIFGSSDSVTLKPIKSVILKKCSACNYYEIPAYKKSEKKQFKHYQKLTP